MTDPPEIYDPPRPRPMRLALIASVLFNIMALILLVIGQITAGTAFVALALVAGLVGLFQGRTGAGNAPSGGRTPGAGSPPVARG